MAAVVGTATLAASVLSAAFDGHAATSAREPLPAVVRPFPSGLSGTLVFESDVAGRAGLYVLDLSAGTVRRLAGHPGITERTPRWSPDGRRVVFSSNRASDGGATTQFDVWTVAADGSQPTRLTDHPANDGDPSWTPDGARVVFSSDRDSRGDLYAVDLATRQTTRLTQHFVGRAIMPAAAPVGARIAFAAQTLRMGAFWDYQVHVRDESGAVKPLDSDAGACWPRWSPDGTALAHVRLAANSPSSIQIRRGPALAPTKVITADRLWSYYPAWSPDATRLAFSVSPEHHEGENWDLAVVHVETGQWTRLTQGPGNDRLPDWKR
jgi:Tol biopolymer transport system component